MLGLAGIPLGLLVHVPRSRRPSAPAAAVGDLVVGALDDVGAAPKAAAGRRRRHVRVGRRARGDRARARGDRAGATRRRARSTSSQDRLVEKEAFRALGIATAPFRAVDDRADLRRRGRRARPARGAEDAARRLRRQGPGRAARRRRRRRRVGRSSAACRCILEGFVPFDRELSIVAVRGRDGEVRVLARRRERAPRRHPAR